MKRTLLMVLVLAMLLSSCTVGELSDIDGAAEPSAAPSVELSAESAESECVEPAAGDESVPEEVILKNFDVLRVIWNSLPENPYHTYSYYSSMGCDDIACTDPEHTHWCPALICRDLSHWHSAEEYELAETTHPTCPCHEWWANMHTCVQP